MMCFILFWAMGILGNVENARKETDPRVYKWSACKAV